MSHTVKLVVYVVLILGAAFFASGFYRTYSEAMKSPPSQSLPGDPTSPAPVPEDGGESHAGRLMKWGAFLFVFAVSLALMGAHDLSQLFAHRAERFLFSEEGEAMRDPDYELAEKSWADGNHLEAIQLMREHLKQNPRHQYVAIRIAEIYENDMHNYVAAALEYEEVLKHPITPERWGWAAIHLANLYSGKLNQPKLAETWLRRIVEEHSATSAAKKARERLGIPEPDAEPAAPAPSVEASSATAAESESTSNLPPGFRPKKGK